MSIDANDEPQVEAIREKIKAVLAQSGDSGLYITQGYICRNSKGEVDNLKREEAIIVLPLLPRLSMHRYARYGQISAAMHNNDPRIVEKTKPIEQLSFDEAAELAYFGAKILHPASIWPAQQYKIPVKLLNTMEPSAKGTLIAEKALDKGVKAIAAKDGITAVNVKSSRMLLAYGFLRKVFEVFEKYRTPIDMITTSEVAVSLTIDNDTHLKEIIKELSVFSSASFEQGQSIISIVGNEVASDGGTLKKVFDSLSEVNVRMVSYGGSTHNISLLVPGGEKKKVLQLLNKGLFDL
jgi:aspartate kinase